MLWPLRCLWKHYHSYLYWIISVAVKRYILSVYIPSVMYKAGSFGWAFLGCIWFILNLPRLCLWLQAVHWHWYIRLALGKQCPWQDYLATSKTFLHHHCLILACVVGSHFINFVYPLKLSIVFLSITWQHDRRSKLKNFMWVQIKDYIKIRFFLFDDTIFNVISLKRWDIFRRLFLLTQNA